MVKPQGDFPVKVRVFDYTDYRKYLLDYYQERKKTSKAFSYRYFAGKAGINSVGLYKDVIEGRQSLGRGLMLKFSQALELNDRESEYFLNMVLFNEASSIEERRLYFRKLMSSYDSKAYKVDGTQYEFYSKWYYSAIRALLSYFPCDGDFSALARCLNPPIRPEQAKKAIKVLEKLGMIGRDAHGNYRPLDAVITTGSGNNERNVQTLNLINFQKAMLLMAAKSYDSPTFKEMDMSTLTMSFSRETFQIIKQEIVALRKKIAGLAELDAKPDRVYQMSYNLFPLTKLPNANL
jgi:uncharacterized protein (TIGR02147 family)